MPAFIKFRPLSSVTHPDVTRDGWVAAAGDALVVGKDFMGTWEIVKAVRNHFDVKLD